MSQGDLASLVKTLINENEVSTLLMLAQHPDFLLDQLHSIHWGCDFGFSRVRGHAIAAYVYVSLLATADKLRNLKYKDLASYQWLTRPVMMKMDYDAQRLPHRNFFGLNPMAASAVDALEDLPRLRQYLKNTFSLMYRFDMLHRGSVGWIQCGRSIF